MTEGELTAEQIRALLHELGRRLQAAGAHGDVKLVGGAALILQVVGNRPTADIDASYADPHTIHAVVADMAADYDFAPGWLNTNAAAFVPDNATPASTQYHQRRRRRRPRLRQVRRTLHPSRGLS